MSLRFETGQWVAKLLILFFLINPFTTIASAGWRDVVNDIKGEVKKATEKPVSGLTDQEISKGLKEALHIGAKKSVDTLSKPNGFFRDAAVKIPMPEKLSKAEKLLRKLGQKKMADDFIKTMNRAAESAVKTTFSVLAEAVANMSIKDALRILKGQDDEATRYFREKKGVHLHDLILPIVQKATRKTGVTSKYKKLVKRARKINPFLSKDLPDIDQYVTGKALDGLFVKIAVQEKKIRKEPVARTSALLKKVFGKR